MLDRGFEFLPPTENCSNEWMLEFSLPLNTIKENSEQKRFPWQQIQGNFAM